jgi:hypothetical protein
VLTVALTLYLNSDNNIKLTGLSDADDGSYLNAATVTYTIKNEAGSTVTGGTGTLTYVTASNGNYLGVVDSLVVVTTSATPFTLNGSFFLELSVDSGAYEDFRRIPVNVAYRQQG